MWYPGVRRACSAGDAVKCWWGAPTGTSRTSEPSLVFYRSVELNLTAVRRQIIWRSCPLIPGLLSTRVQNYLRRPRVGADSGGNHWGVGVRQAQAGGPPSIT